MSALSCLNMQLELIDVEFPTPKRREVGERLCLGLNCKTTPYMAHKTEIYGQLLTFICEELKAIDGVKDFTFTSIHLGHNTNDVSPPACLPGSITHGHRRLLGRARSDRRRKAAVEHPRPRGSLRNRPVHIGHFQ